MAVTRVTLNGAEAARFTYDPFGRRAQKVAGAVTTTWAYDGDDIVQETLVGGSGAGTFRYVHGPGIDEPLARETVGTGALEYFHGDGLGSVISTTNQAGAIVSTRRYDAWGNLEVGATVPGYAFTGREWDPETGLYYHRARYYDPKVGRFISEDPVGFAAGVNSYAYASNSSTNATDPSGLWSPNAHDYILQRSFGGTLSQADIDILKAESRAFDEQTQAPQFANMHAMARVGQSPIDATREIGLFVELQIAQSRVAFRSGDRTEGLRQLARALHTLMDSASPRHCDDRGAPRIWGDLGGGILEGAVRRHSPGLNPYMDQWGGREKAGDVRPWMMATMYRNLNDALRRSTIE